VAFIGFECVQIELLVYNVEHKNSCGLRTKKVNKPKINTMLEVERELLAECFALLGVAHFTDEMLSGKRQDARDKLIKILKPKNGI